MRRHRVSRIPPLIHVLFLAAIAAAAALSIAASAVFSASGDSTGDRVYGHNGSFTNWQCNSTAAGGLNAKSLCTPYDLAWESKGSVDRIFVADYGNHRVLRYDGTSTTAVQVFGQGGSFTANTCNNGGISATSLCGPYSVALDSAGNMYVAEVANNRVLEFDDPLGTCGTCDTTADRVFGQPNFTTGDPASPNECSPPVKRKRPVFAHQGGIRRRRESVCCRQRQQSSTSVQLATDERHCCGCAVRTAELHVRNLQQRRTHCVIALRAGRTSL